MNRYRTALLAALLLLVPAVSALAVGQGRLQAEVVDENGEPLAGVEVHITADEIAYEKTLTTKKNGRITLLVVDATRTYTFQFSKEGYRPVQEQVKLTPGDVTRKTFTVPSLEAAPMAPSAEDVAAVEGRNKAVKAFNDGVRLMQSGDAAAAKEQFLEAARIDAEMPQPLSALAGIYLDEKDYAQAVATADKLLALDPDNPRALQIQYDAYVEMGDEAKAAAALDRLSALEGGGTDAAVRVFNQGAEAARVGDVDTAVVRFEKAAELDPELAPAHAALAGIYFDRGDHQKAVEAAEAALGVDPDLVEVQKIRYEGYRRMGQEEKAKEVFAEMAESDPEGLAETLYENGRRAFDAGNAEQARTAFEQALAADPDYARAHYMLGLVYVNMGDGAKAKEHLQKFIDMAPDDPEVATAREMLQYAG
jgi:tetratricopeptide (TPR) repeat protein